MRTLQTQRRPPGAPAVRALPCLPLRHKAPPACSLLLQASLSPQSSSLSSSFPVETLVRPPAQITDSRHCGCRREAWLGSLEPPRRALRRRQRNRSGKLRGARASSSSSSAPAHSGEQMPPLRSSPSPTDDSHATRVSRGASLTFSPSPFALGRDVAVIEPRPPRACSPPAMRVLFGGGSTVGRRASSCRARV